MSSVVVSCLDELQRDIYSHVTRTRRAPAVRTSVGTRQSNVQRTVVMTVGGGIAVDCPVPVHYYVRATGIRIVIVTICIGPRLVVSDEPCVGVVYSVSH